MAHKIADKKEAKRSAILAAARAVLVKREYDEVLVADIARKAGVAKGTIFLYYKNKDELYRAVFRSLFEDLGVKLDAVEKSGLPPREMLKKAIVTLCSNMERNHNFMERMRRGHFRPRTPPGPPRHDLMRANHQRLYAILKRCHEGGLIKGDGLDFIPYVLFPMCRSLCGYKAVEGGSLGVEEGAERIMGILLRGIGK